MTVNGFIISSISPGLSNRDEVSELNAQWQDHQSYWNGIFSLESEIDSMIEEFNTSSIRDKPLPKHVLPIVWGNAWCGKGQIETNKA